MLAFATPVSISTFYSRSLPSQTYPQKQVTTTICTTTNSSSKSRSSSGQRNKKSLPKTSARRPSYRKRARTSRPSGEDEKQPANDKWDRVQPGRRTQRVSPTVTPRTSDLRPENCPALVLNADFSPLSYMPLSLWPWQDVVKAVFLDRVTVVETYDVGVRSPGMIFPLPSVISLKEYQPVTLKKPAFTRFNVFLRDEFACQYCGGKFSTHDLTFDHVVPRCMGGKTNWTNVVTACVRCNHAKGRKLLKDLQGMKLRRKAVEPSSSQLQMVSKKFPPQYLHESWRDYVYWSQSMEVEVDTIHDQAYDHEFDASEN